MNLRSLLGAILLLQLFSPGIGEAEVRIQDDLGGPLGDYILMFRDVRNSGENVVIDGRCFSACTILTGLIPRNRICVTSRAMLGFHAARGPDAQGRLTTNRAATRMMYSFYPAPIKDWVQLNGGLGSETIVLSGKDLAKYYSACR